MDEMPLFERDDIEEMLEPLGKKAAPLPLPEPMAASAKVDPFDAIVISRTRATILAVAVFALIGLAFGLGYIIRGYAVTGPS